MSHLNTDLQVRRELAERITKLQEELDTERKNTQNIADTITQYVISKERAEQKCRNLTAFISNVAESMPPKRRQQILDAIPNL